MLLLLDALGPHCEAVGHCRAFVTLCIDLYQKKREREKERKRKEKRGGREEEKKKKIEGMGEKKRKKKISNLIIDFKMAGVRRWRRGRVMGGESDGEMLMGGGRRGRGRRVREREIPW